MESRQKLLCLTRECGLAMLSECSYLSLSQPATASSSVGFVCTYAGRWHVTGWRADQAAAKGSKEITIQVQFIKFMSGVIIMYIP